MARNDIKLVTPESQLISTKWLVAAGAMGTTGGYKGEPFMSRLATAAQTGIVIMCADADGTISTGATADGRFVGIAKSDSTQTAAAAGVVYTYTPFPFIVYVSKPKTAGLCNTDAKIDALRGKAVIFDLTTSTYSVDVGATDAATNALMLVGGDPKADVVYFTVKNGWSFLGSVTTLS
jgi:hypothetical protein